MPERTYIVKAKRVVRNLLLFQRENHNIIIDESRWNREVQIQV